MPLQLSLTCRLLHDLDRCYNVDMLTRALAHGASNLCLSTYYVEPICRVAFLKQVWVGPLG